ncbi:MAG: tetratricopeptide repeat protein [Candidatus Omnitrophica bacterium]|nr:tetratricopeptide repeat protein [Candidatus Omnitrophota bacterium]
MKKSDVRRQMSENRFPVFCLLFSVFCLLFSVFCYAQDSSDYVNKAWSHLGKREFSEAHLLVDECIEIYSTQAEDQAKALEDFPTKGEEDNFKIMDDVATCYFIKGEALMREGKTEEAKVAFTKAIDKYPYAQSFDPRGWYWSIKEKSEITLKKLETGRVEEENGEEEVVISEIELYDKGEEFPVDYVRYGEFQNIGEENYKYVIINPIELSKATGEGIYPNSTSVKFDPEFAKIKKTLFEINHWKIANSRDLSTAFYKWNIAPESEAMKQFIRAELLERSGLVEHAIKGYYSILVHFPRSYGWTYWHTPWYVGKAALYRIKYLLRNNPQLNLILEGGEIIIINGYDNDIRNDTFLVDPGKLRTLTFWEKIFAFSDWGKKRRNWKKIVETKGKRVQLVKYESGDWQLLVDNKPFMIKGMTYGPTRVGESPDDGSMQNWTTQDLNKDSIVDSPYQSWVDKDRNNQQNEGEIAVGDFQLMKEMGVNTLRFYHQPFELNKKIFRQMYQKYGIYILMGDFLGKYALGSG